MRLKVMLGLAAGALALLPGLAQADVPGKHPAYLHAMSNVRVAYWLIDHRESGDPAANWHERKALGELRAAFREIRNAAIYDGKDIADQPPPGMTWYDHRGRLSRASDLLRDTENDIRREEDDRAVRGLQHRALQHVDGALHQTQDAMHDFKWW